MGNLTGPTATINRKTPGNFFAVQDVLLDTARNSSTNYLQIQLRQRGNVLCSMQRLEVSYGETEASQYQTNLMEAGDTFTIEFPTKTKSDNYNVTAIILDKFGNPQNSYIEFVGTPPGVTTSTGEPPPTQIILATLTTQAPGFTSDQGTQSTRLLSITPTPPHSMEPDSTDDQGSGIGAGIGGAVATAAAAVAATVVVVVVVKKQAGSKAAPGTEPEQDVDMNNLEKGQEQEQVQEQETEEPTADREENTEL